MDPRSLEGKKLIDSLEDLAEKLLDYVANMSNVPELKEAIKTSKTKYQNTYWGLGWLYSYFRQRGPSADQLKADIEESGDTKTLLPPLLQFLSKGGTETTSLNTEFMYDLIDRFMQGNKYADANARNGMTHAEIKRLHELFLKQARFFLDKDSPETIFEKLQDERSEELKAWFNKDPAVKPVKSDASDVKAKQVATALMSSVFEELRQKVQAKNKTPAERQEQPSHLPEEKMRSLAELRQQWLNNEEKRQAREQRKNEKKLAAQQKVRRLQVDEITLLDKDDKPISLLDHFNKRYGVSPDDDNGSKPEPKKLDLSNHPVARLFGHREKPKQVGKLDMSRYGHLSTLFANPDLPKKAKEAQLDAAQKHEAESSSRLAELSCQSQQST